MPKYSISNETGIVNVIEWKKPVCADFCENLSEMRFHDGPDLLRPAEGPAQPGRCQEAQKGLLAGGQLIEINGCAGAGRLQLQLVKLHCGVVADHIADDVHGVLVKMRHRHQIPAVPVPAFEAVGGADLLIEGQQVSSYLSGQKGR